VSTSVFQRLGQVLRKIDRPGSFCVSGSVPVVLPGLEVAGLGPIGLPLTALQAEELKKHCEQAPYGKGEETLVDTNVRRVWHLQPDRFALTNPDWQQLLQQMVRTLQKELGLERQKLESHLYDLLLYEPGSFFLPHRDGEKLERMVATLVVVLPSTFQGGELVVRHEGQEQVVDFRGGENNPFRIHFAAFYADCEHEVRPLREGYRLCLVYNLTLKKSKKAITAPRSSEHVEAAAKLLREWAGEDAARRLAVTLDHQYTQDGLVVDALKGADRAKAQVLFEAARRADCHAYLALLTFHESGSAVDHGGYYRRRRRHWGYGDEEEFSGPHEMEEVFESSLTADHWSDRTGQRLPFGALEIEEVELLDPEALLDVEPEEQFEGYTGNAGMTLERWYRHAAVFIWPNRKHFDVLCDAGSANAVKSLELLVKQWQQSGRKDAALHAQCVEFAAAILPRWQGSPYLPFGQPAEPSPLLSLLAVLDEPRLIQAYLIEVLTQDATADPGKSLPAILQKHGWKMFRWELEVVFQKTTTATLERNVRLLEQICTASPRQKEGVIELCGTLAQATVQALEAIDQGGAAHDYRVRAVKRAEVLAGLARALLITDQCELLERLVAHVLARPETYPLESAHVAALTALGPWLEEHVKQPCPGLSHWLAACCEQLKGRTAQAPQAPADFRRPAAIACKCADCSELRRFLDDPHEQVHRFRAAEARRSHLENTIRQHHCDLDLTTERRGSPYTLVCTKNTASYQAKLWQFRQDQEHLAKLRAIQASVRK
jgi:hypothetical protein